MDENDAFQTGIDRILFAAKLSRIVAVDGIIAEESVG